MTTASQAAECKKLGAAGDGLTKDIAIIMSTHGLANIMADRGLKGQGPVKTTCKAGSFMVECNSSQLACK
jgi:hypothetical protein